MRYENGPATKDGAIKATSIRAGSAILLTALTRLL
jgi:hypothetical protein